MSCCDDEAGGAKPQPNAVAAESRIAEDGLRHTVLSVPSIHCGGCVQRIETALRALPGVTNARVNLSSKLATVGWSGATPPPLIEALEGIGFAAHLYDIGAGERDDVLPELVWALAVAGFAAMNIMLLSVSVWSGAEPPTRTLFHWISAVIAFPTLVFSGRVFFRSAWRSVTHGQTNMDVPISIGVILAFAMSLYETIAGGEHAFFDASVSLLFFLLIGRTLDHVMRERARQAVKGLARLAVRGAMVRQPDGAVGYVPINDIRPGMVIVLAAGERVPVDAVVLGGESDLDCSLVSGETLPLRAATGTKVLAGTLNITGPLTIEATAAVTDSFLAEMMRMMEAAESGRSTYRRIADRAARLYAPVVHATALLALVGWIVATGDFHRALTIAVAVLIITCPCALGLAVPMVQVVAAKRLFEGGIMVKDGGAMERLAEIDTVVFDKTGTLTLGAPVLAGVDAVDRAWLGLAAGIASHSRHPYSRALTVAGSSENRGQFTFSAVSEYPGLGLEARADSSVYRLGRATWAVLGDMGGAPESEESSVALSQDGRLLATFHFDDAPRPDVREAIDELRGLGCRVEMVSGDREGPVRRLAAQLGIPYAAGVLPGDKVAHLAALAAAGHKVMMVGDGLNDAPALVAAHASMAPAAAADVGRSAADFVFLRESLSAVPQAVAVARNAAVLVRQNLALAVAYNAVAVPVAILGHVTPLVAAISMSMSSLVVVANALRLKRRAPSPGAMQASVGGPGPAPLSLRSAA